MKMIVAVVLALVAMSHAASIPAEEIPILRSDFSSQPDGSYVSSFETGNGIVRSDVGELKQVPGEDNKPQIVVVMRGSFSYPKEDGTIETITYEADEAGYRALGSSVPKTTRR